MNNKKGASAFAACNKNNKTIIKSSSGGVFYALAKHYICNLGGIVYGATILHGNVLHKRIDKESQIEDLLKSKYVLSETKNTFFECFEDLNNGRYVLYVGTPCQIAALYHYLEIKKVNTNKLLSVDLFCHGVPQKKYWDQYLTEKGFEKTNLIVDFRYKKPSWESFSLFIKNDKKKQIKTFVNDEYMQAFLKNYILMDSCYQCKYKGENRLSDISLGDFWGIKYIYPEYFNKNGTSFVIIRNKADYILDILKESCLVHKVDCQLSLQFNTAYNCSVEKPNNIDAVRKQIDESGFNNSLIKSNSSYYLKLKEKLKNALMHVLTKRKITKISSKDIGIITDYGYSNFGNRLQNYSLRKTITDIGFNPVNVSNKSDEYLFGVKHIRNCKNRAKSKKKYLRIKSIYFASKKSGEKTIPFSYTKYGKKQIKLFRTMVFGSDQIWNTGYNKSNIPFHLGMFATNCDIKKISYAASFGQNKIDERSIGLFKSGLDDFSNIGVREKRGVEIAKELGFNATLNADPTLLLTKEEWDEAINKFSKHQLPNQKYYFKYLLNFGDKLDDPIDEYCLDVMNENSPYYISNHFDFVNYIKNSELVVSDSFHAFVFSIIYKKKIMLLPREDMKSR